MPNGRIGINEGWELKMVSMGREVGIRFELEPFTRDRGENFPITIR